MNKIITKEDILLYIYNELPINEINNVEYAIATDIELLKSYQEMLLIVNKLKNIEENPSETVISIINEESRSSSLEMS